MSKSSGSGSSVANQLGVKLFADGADIEAIVALRANPLIQGFTTNPTLMRKAGVADYEWFARQVLDVIGDLPLSLEVFADDFDEMERQARKIASWGDNVYVKIPVTTTDGSSTAVLQRRLSGEGIRLNVTALMNVRQVVEVTEALSGGAPGYVSVFAGRIADAGKDPLPIIEASLAVMAAEPQLELIWASPREVLNIMQADWSGCHVITVTSDLLAKLGSLGRDLNDFSLATVRMFRDDAVASGYVL